MGTFSDRMKAAFRGKKALKEFNKKHGLKPDAKLKTLSEIGKPMYMLRVIGSPKLLVHFEDGDYIVREGMIGACGWTWETGHAFLKSAPDYNLELIHIQEAEKAFTKEELRNPLLDK